jgi:hypothetical protein
MKPRITYGWHTVFIGAFISVQGWYCSGNGRQKFGVTPKHAYDEWAKQPAWPPGAFIEQHICPPKPTLFQKWLGSWA